MNDEKQQDSVENIWYDFEYIETENDDEDQNILVCNKESLLFLHKQLQHIAECDDSELKKIDYPDIEDIGDVPFTHIKLAETRLLDDESEENSDGIKEYLKPLLLIASAIFIFVYGFFAILLDIWGAISTVLNIESDMPLWAYIYLFALIVFEPTAIKENISKRVSRAVYFVGEVLSIVIAIAVFLFYYDVINKPESLFIVLIMSLYIVLWELLVNIENYNLKNHLQKFTDIIDDIDSQSTKRFIIFGALASVIFVLPLIVIMLLLILSYF